ncbi:hypothetical protein GR160_13110 [Flavobacterium sp. Sd200]|uniref:hypothetical protein n=1 Tax=Flavobacterium sp. Sd200 TaxID=2692211 RepID=UPI00136BC146|nr:hypothetical protein [Flavobacterium sp. Sd200]MXN92167.1 hypothetical protein [Flavobacterium sp. Sd200]
MDLEARKINFVQEFLRIENEKIISSLEALLRKNKTELFEKELQPMSLQKFHSDIDKSIEDSESNKVVSANDLIAKAQKWS